MKYEIPDNVTPLIDVGTWVEIIKSYDFRAKTNSIKVSAMRIGSEILAFADNSADEKDFKPLRPHEGQITQIENQPGKTLFSIRLS